MPAPRSIRAKSFMDWQNRAMNSMRAVGRNEWLAEAITCELNDLGLPCRRSDINTYDDYFSLHTEFITIEYSFGSRKLKASLTHSISISGRDVKRDQFDKDIYLAMDADKNIHVLAENIINIMKKCSHVLYNMTVIIRKIDKRLEEMKASVMERRYVYYYGDHSLQYRVATMSYEYEFELKEDSSCNTPTPVITGRANNMYGGDYYVKMVNAFEFVDTDKAVDAIMKHLMKIRILNPSPDELHKSVNAITNIKYCAIHEILQDYSFKQKVDWSRSRSTMKYEKPGYVFIEIKDVSYDNSISMDYYYGEGYSDGSIGIRWDKYTLKSNKYETLYKNITKIARKACADRC